MRFGISATSWIRPNIFRKRLCPFVVCCCAIFTSRSLATAHRKPRLHESGDSGETSHVLVGCCPDELPDMGAARASFNPPILLQLDGRSGGLELLLDLLGLVLGHAFFHWLWRTF